MRNGKTWRYALKPEPAPPTNTPPQSTAERARIRVLGWGKVVRKLISLLTTSPFFSYLYVDTRRYLRNGGVRKEHPCLFKAGGSYEEREV
jgi:hypothetical protein